MTAGAGKSGKVGKVSSHRCLLSLRLLFLDFANVCEEEREKFVFDVSLFHVAMTYSNNLTDKALRNIFVTTFFLFLVVRSYLRFERNARILHFGK